MPDERLWVALVTFERSGVPQDVLADEFQGACGWMACLAADEEEVRARLAASLRAVGLRLLEVDREQQVDAEEIVEFDEHLAANVQGWEPGRKTLWGTIHCYRAEGSA
jgi:hypothetical protein